jgi:hypothetical protein
MKTKEQILQHLKVAGYKRSEIGKIMGFLIGNGTKTPTEAIHYSVGTGTFDDFFTWYQSEPDELEEEKCAICEMFRLVFEAMAIADVHCETQISDILDELLDKMLDEFVVDATKEDCNCNEDKN